MDGITFLEHTADVKFVVKGKDISDCFKKATIGFYTVMCDINKVKTNKELKIHIQANSLEALLYDYLTELIFYLDTENFLAGEVLSLNIKKTEDSYELNADLLGQEIKSIEDLEVYSYVKSATYSDMKIDTQKNEMTIVLDI